MTEPDHDPLTAQTGLTATERTLRAQLAAHARWATGNTGDCGPLGQAGLIRRFEAEVDPDGRLAPEERARRVESKRREHIARMTLASIKARRVREQRR